MQLWGHFKVEWDANCAINCALSVFYKDTNVKPMLGKI